MEGVSSRFHKELLSACTQTTAGLPTHHYRLHWNTRSHNYSMPWQDKWREQQHNQALHSHGNLWQQRCPVRNRMHHLKQKNHSVRWCRAILPFHQCESKAQRTEAKKKKKNHFVRLESPKWQAFSLDTSFDPSICRGWFPSPVSELPSSDLASPSDTLCFQPAKHLTGFLLSKGPAKGWAVISSTSWDRSL